MNKSTWLLIGALLLTACAPSQEEIDAAPCSVARVATYEAAMKSVVADFDAAYDLAKNTPRSGLAVPITTMQEARKAASEIETPACLASASDYMLSAMDNDIGGFLNFLGQGEDSVTTNYFSAAGDDVSRFTNELARVKACAPDC